MIDRTSTSSVVLGSASLAALLAVGFIVANAIGGRILASRRDIGLLKAAGFTPGGVTSLFVVENLILAGAASVVGTALGIAFSPLLLEPTANAARHVDAERAAPRHGGRGRARRRRRRGRLHGGARLAGRAPRRARGDRARAHDGEHEAVARRARRNRAAPAARGGARRQGRVRQPVARRHDDREPGADDGTSSSWRSARRRPTAASSRTRRCGPSPTSCWSTPRRSPARTRALLAAQSEGVAGTATVRAPRPRCPAARSTCGRGRSAATTRAGPTRCATAACSPGRAR